MNGSDYHNFSTYQSYVDNLAVTGSTELIPNGLPDHARVIIGTIFKHAKKEVCMLSDSLREDIYGHNSVLDSLEKFLSSDKDRKVKIILQGDEDIFGKDTLDELKQERKFIEVCSKYASQVDIRKSTKKIDKRMSKHFTVMDRTGYRYCPDKTVTEAIACFNDSSTASHLRNQFEILFNRSNELNNKTVLQ